MEVTNIQVDSARPNNRCLEVSIAVKIKFTRNKKSKEDETNDNDIEGDERVTEDELQYHYQEYAQEYESGFSEVANDDLQSLCSDRELQRPERLESTWNYDTTDEYQQDVITSNTDSRKSSESYDMSVISEEEETSQPIILQDIPASKVIIQAMEIREEWEAAKTDYFLPISNNLDKVIEPIILREDVTTSTKTTVLRDVTIDDIPADEEYLVHESTESSQLISEDVWIRKETATISNKLLDLKWQHTSLHIANGLHRKESMSGCSEDAETSEASSHITSDDMRSSNEDEHDYSCNNNTKCAIATDKASCHANILPGKYFNFNWDTNRPVAEESITNTPVAEESITNTPVPGESMVNNMSVDTHNTYMSAFKEYQKESTSAGDIKVLPTSHTLPTDNANEVRSNGYFSEHTDKLKTREGDNVINERRTDTVELAKVEISRSPQNGFQETDSSIIPNLKLTNTNLSIKSLDVSCHSDVDHVSTYKPINVGNRTNAIVYDGTNQQVDNLSPVPTNVESKRKLPVPNNVHLSGGMARERVHLSGGMAREREWFTRRLLHFTWDNEECIRKDDVTGNINCKEEGVTKDNLRTIDAENINTTETCMLDKENIFHLSPPISESPKKMTNQLGAKAPYIETKSMPYTEPISSDSTKTFSDNINEQLSSPLDTGNAFKDYFQELKGLKLSGVNKDFDWMKIKHLEFDWDKTTNHGAEEKATCIEYTLEDVHCTLTEESLPLEDIPEVDCTLAEVGTLADESSLGDTLEEVNCTLSEDSLTLEEEERLVDEDEESTLVDDSLPLEEEERTCNRLVDVDEESIVENDSYSKELLEITRYELLEELYKQNANFLSTPNFSWHNNGLSLLDATRYVNISQVDRVEDLPIAFCSIPNEVIPMDGKEESIISWSDVTNEQNVFMSPCISEGVKRADSPIIWNDETDDVDEITYYVEITKGENTSPANGKRDLSTINEIEEISMELLQRKPIGHLNTHYVNAMVTHEPEDDVDNLSSISEEDMQLVEISEVDNKPTIDWPGNEIPCEKNEIINIVDDERFIRMTVDQKFGELSNLITDYASPLNIDVIGLSQSTGTNHSKGFIHDSTSNNEILSEILPLLVTGYHGSVNENETGYHGSVNEKEISPTITRQPPIKENGILSEQIENEISSGRCDVIEKKISSEALPCDVCEVHLENGIPKRGVLKQAAIANATQEDDKAQRKGIVRDHTIQQEVPASDDATIVLDHIIQQEVPASNDATRSIESDMRHSVSQLISLLTSIDDFVTITREEERIVSEHDTSSVITSEKEGEDNQGWNNLSEMMDFVNDNKTTQLLPSIPLNFSWDNNWNGGSEDVIIENFMLGVKSSIMKPGDAEMPIDDSDYLINIENNSNEALQTHTDTDNDFLINIEHNSNEALQTHTDTGNECLVNIEDDSNEALQTQVDTDNDFLINIEHNSNEALQTHTYTDNECLVNIKGDSNEALQTQVDTSMISTSIGVDNVENKRTSQINNGNERNEHVGASNEHVGYRTDKQKEIFRHAFNPVTENKRLQDVTMDNVRDVPQEKQPLQTPVGPRRFVECRNEVCNACGQKVKDNSLSGSESDEEGEVFKIVVDLSIE